MTEELKKIKKLYGEQMMHYCREAFPSILETEGKLLDALRSNFAESHDLYADLNGLDLLSEFKKYIYNLFEVNYNMINNIDKTPEELMKSVGYTLYECKTEEDIQAFKKYYASGEVLCTFLGNRLTSCYVFFAVKDNVETIKREDFKHPERQDEYGTSVISIQFSRDKSHILSIKNRYNHRVENPDATFGNNLDNIIAGLTDAFEHTYGLKQEYVNGSFEIPGYTRANDGRWYKYNYEFLNIYCCPDNIIIDNGKVKRYAKEKYIVLDYFILDLEKKELYVYYDNIGDSVSKTVGKIKKIIILKKGTEKEVKIINDKDEEIVFEINKKNIIVGLKSNDIKQIADRFLFLNESLMTLDLPNLHNVGNSFLYNNDALTSLNLPSLVQTGHSFLYNSVLKSLYLPKLQQVGHSFLFHNRILTYLDLPMLQKADDSFLFHNESIAKVRLPNLQYAGRYFLFHNKSLICLKLPLLERAGDGFLDYNRTLTELELPNLQKVGNGFLYSNNSLVSLYLPNLQTTEEQFLYENEILESINLPLLQKVGYGFLYSNKKLEPEKYALLRKMYMFLFKKNIESCKINLPNLEIVGGGFICSNEPVRGQLLRRINH